MRTWLELGIGSLRAADALQGGWHTASGTVAVFMAFIATLAAWYEGRLPRILRRRFDDEMRADPVAAARRRRRDRTWRFVGWGLGIVGGAVGIFAGWLASS